MKDNQIPAIDSLLAGFQGMLIDDPDILRYAVKKLAARYFESHKDTGRKITGKTYLAAIGALEANNLQLKQELEAMEKKVKEEKAKKKS